VATRLIDAKHRGFVPAEQNWDAQRLYQSMKQLLVLLFSVLALSAADLSGNWPGMLETARGVDDHNLTLRQSGNTLTGTIAFSRGKWDLQNVKLDGQKLTFDVTMSGASPWVLSYDLQVAGDEIAGKVSAKQGQFPGGKVRFKREK
jgi:hypothetical protein